MSLAKIFVSHTDAATKTLQVDYVVLNGTKALEAVDNVEAGAQALWKSARVYVIEDQVVPANAPDISEQQQKMAAFAKKHGCHYVYGQAMSSHYLAQGIVQAGNVVVSADPDIAMLGAVGAVGMAVSQKELAKALVAGAITFVEPHVFKVKLTNKLAVGVDIRDAAHSLVAALKEQVKAATLIEFSAEEVALTLEEKMLLCGWCQKLGVVSAVFTDASATQADYVLELDKVPGGKIASAAQAVRVVYIGGAYGGTLAAIKYVAEHLAGKKVAYQVRLNVAPASNAIYLAAANAGYIATIMDAEGMVLNQCALPPVQSRVGVGEVMVSNDIHDEKDYAGKDGIIYLTSTSVAVQAALTGKIGGDL